MNARRPDTRSAHSRVTTSSRLSISDATAVSGQPDEIVVNVQRDGQIIVRTQVVPLDDLEGQLKAARERFPGQAVIVRGDADVSYRFVMSAMGAARRAGIRNLSLAYRQGESAP